MRNYLVSISLIIFSNLAAQRTVGVLSEAEGRQTGYTFFSPFSSEGAYLVDDCGRLINHWDRGSFPGLSAYLREDGRLFRSYKVNPQGPFQSASNAGGVELVDWDNTLLWSWELNSPSELSHHDAVPLPDGHFLVLSWQLVPRDELIRLGRDPDEIHSRGHMWSERILEIDPLADPSEQIVWEWNIKDHYIQDYDPDGENYGIVADHPERFNINLPDLNSSNSNSSWDWNHFNAIDYHAELDQILISVRNSDELWIIDHSTTTEEARGSSGGRYGRGGDILYRYGNAAAYARGVPEDQQLFGQHGCQWQDRGTDEQPAILVFNNGNGRPGPDYSSADYILPPTDSLGFYTRSAVEAYGPAEAERLYEDRELYSPFLSNAQRLDNGNLFMNYGSLGRLRELSPEGDIVWEYEIPLRGDQPLRQGSFPNGNSSFRAYCYPQDYAGFIGRDLSPGEILELDADPWDCSLPTDITDLEREAFSWSVQGDELIILQADPGDQIDILDLQGVRRVPSLEFSSTPSTLSLAGLPSGVYVVHRQTRTQQRAAYLFIIP